MIWFIAGFGAGLVVSGIAYYVGMSLLYASDEIEDDRFNYDLDDRFEPTDINRNIGDYS